MNRYLLLICMVSFLFSCGESKVHKGPPPKLFSNLNIKQSKYRKIREEFKAQGNVISRDAANLKAKVMGEVKAIMVKEGDEVKKGEVLLKIDDSIYIARLKQARGEEGAIEKELVSAKGGLDQAMSQFLLAKKTFNRFRHLREKKVVSKQKFDEVVNNFNRAKSALLSARSNVEAIRSRLKMAKAGVEEAKVYLGYTEIRAPFNGRVTQKFVDIGDTVIPGSPLISIQHNDRYQIKCVVPEGYINFVKKGEQLRVYIMNKQIKARVSSIIYQGNPMSRSYGVKLDIPTFDFIKPGMYATVYLPIMSKDFLLIPESSIVSYGQIQGVFVVDDKGIVNFRVIRTGRKIDNQIEVISGLKPGERYVVSPPSTLADGDRVS